MISKNVKIHLILPLLVSCCCWVLTSACLIECLHCLVNERRWLSVVRYRHNWHCTFTRKIRIWLLFKQWRWVLANTANIEHSNSSRSNNVVIIIITICTLMVICNVDWNCMDFERGAVSVIINSRKWKHVDWTQFQHTEQLGGWNWKDRILLKDPLSLITYHKWYLQIPLKPKTMRDR